MIWSGHTYISPMRHLILAAPFAALALNTPASAEEESGRSLMEEGARLFMEGILREVEPGLSELQRLLEGLEPAFEDFAANMGPALRQLLEEVEDWSAYHPPEILPNGDIILRRKQPKAPETEGEIEL